MKNIMRLSISLIVMVGLAFGLGACITINNPGIPTIPSYPTTTTPVPTTTPPPTIPGSTFSITSLTANVDNPSYAGPCPKILNFSAAITTNGPGTITYRWERSDSSVAPVRTVNFPAAGSQMVIESMELGGSYSGWARVHILSPVDIVSNQVDFVVSCGFAFGVTGAIATVDSPAGPCPRTFTFTGVITTNGPGTVTYRWERSDNAIAPVQTLTFASAGSQTVTDTWQLGGNYNGWERLHILSPADSLSNRAVFNLVCGLAVTGTVASVDSPVGPCPRTFTFTGVITVDGPGTVTYRWERSDNAIAPVQTLTFASAGSQTVTDTWQLGGNYNGWERIHILTPNEGISNQANFTISCP